MPSSRDLSAVAPVADEAAIEAWERDWDAATRTLHFRIQRDEFDGVRAMGARAVRLMRAAPRNDDGRLRKLLDLAKFVVDCDDFKKSPSDLLVVFDGRFVQDIRKLLAESPAGDAGESEARGLLKEAMGAFEPWVRGPGVVGGILHLQEEVGNLRARLQAAEAERDALAKERDEAREGAAYTLVGKLAAMTKERDAAIRDRQDAEELQSKLAADLAAAQKERDEERRKAAEHELNWRSVSDKLVDSWAERDNLQADLAAAKAESARAVVEELLDVQDYFGTQAVNARNAAKRPTPEDKRVGNGYDVQARIWDAAIGNIEHRIHKLRAAQPPQPQPATVRQGDEVLP